MNTKKASSFISGLKIRNIFPFYIDNINKYFFESNKSKKNGFTFSDFIKTNSNDEEAIAFKLNFQVLNVLKYIINNSVFKISQIIGSKNAFPFKYQLIDGHHFFAHEKEKTGDFKIIGHKNFNRQYIFSFETVDGHYLNDFVEQFQFSFYLDEKNNMVSGGVAFNWGGEKPDQGDFKEIISNIFNNDLSLLFIKDGIKKISLNNIISLLEVDQNGKKNFLRDIWDRIIEVKYPKKTQELKSTDFTEELYYGIINSLLIALIIYEDLKRYFRNSNASEIGNVLDTHKRGLVFDFDKLRKNVTPKQNCEDLIFYIKKKYIDLFGIKTSKIKTIDDIEEALEKIEELEEKSFWFPIPSYEFERNSSLPFIDEDDNIFLKNNKFKSLFLLCLKPEIFGLNDNSWTSSYQRFIGCFNNLDFDEEMDEDLEKNVDEMICEWNYDYVTFINKSLTFLIVKNNNPPENAKNGRVVHVDVNKKIYNNYFWSIIYSQARFWKMWSIEEEFNKYKNKKPAIMRNHLYLLNNLQFDWQGDFFGMREIKKIVKKIDDCTKFQESITNLIASVNVDDHSFGKYKERSNAQYFLITAVIFGIFDFFTVIFSVLTVTSSMEKNINSTSLVIIIVSSILLFGLILSAFAAIYKFYLSKIIWKWKKK